LIHREYVCDLPDCGASARLTGTDAAELPPGWVEAVRDGQRQRLHFCGEGCAKAAGARIVGPMTIRMNPPCQTATRYVPVPFDPRRRA
jgi:hypothetical protein